MERREQPAADPPPPPRRGGAAGNEAAPPPVPERRSGVLTTTEASTRQGGVQAVRKEVMQAVFPEVLASGPTIYEFVIAGQEDGPRYQVRVLRHGKWISGCLSAGWVAFARALGVDEAKRIELVRLGDGLGGPGTYLVSCRVP